MNYVPDLQSADDELVEHRGNIDSRGRRVLGVPVGLASCIVVALSVLVSLLAWEWINVSPHVRAVDTYAPTVIDQFVLNAITASAVVVSTVLLYFTYQLYSQGRKAVAAARDALDYAKAQENTIKAQAEAAIRTAESSTAQAQAAQQQAETARLALLEMSRATERQTKELVLSQKPFLNLSADMAVRVDSVGVVEIVEGKPVAKEQHFGRPLRFRLAFTINNIGRGIALEVKSGASVRAYTMCNFDVFTDLPGAILYTIPVVEGDFPGVFPTGIAGVYALALRPDDALQVEVTIDNPIEKVSGNPWRRCMHQWKPTLYYTGGVSQPGGLAIDLDICCRSLETPASESGRFQYRGYRITLEETPDGGFAHRLFHRYFHDKDIDVDQDSGDISLAKKSAIFKCSQMAPELRGLDDLSSGGWLHGDQWWFTSDSSSRGEAVERLSKIVNRQQNEYVRIADDIGMNPSLYGILNVAAASRIYYNARKAMRNRTETKFENIFPIGQATARDEARRSK